MKILIKECKKIMDIRVLLVIAVFTVLFYQLFLEVTIYPAGGQTTDSQYDMPFYAELIESWGTSLPREDWSKLDEKRKELEEAYTRIIAADPVLADAKITNYQEFSKTQETFFDKDTLTDEEKKIDQELSRLVFEDSKGSKLFFELQVLDRLDELQKFTEWRQYLSNAGWNFLYCRKRYENDGNSASDLFCNPCTAVSDTGTIMSCAAVVCNDCYRAETF